MTSPTSTRSAGSLLGRGLRFVVAGLGASAGIGLLLMFAFQSRDSPSTPVAVGQTLTPWLFWWGTIAIVANVMARRHFVTVLLATGLAVTAPLMWANQFQPRGSADIGPDHLAISVIASNVWYENQDDVAAFDTLLAEDADVVVLSEILPARLRTLNSHRITSVYPYRSDAKSPSGQIILSRYRLTMPAKQTMPNRMTDVTAHTDNGPVRILGLHLANPTNNPIAWASQLERVRGVADRARTPIVVAGDFNAGWFHPQYRRLLGNGTLIDAQASSGHPWRMTWPAEGAPGFPVVALDHVLCSPDIAVSATRRIKVPGADHFAVRADLLVPSTATPPDG